MYAVRVVQHCNCTCIASACSCSNRPAALPQTCMGSSAVVVGGAAVAARTSAVVQVAATSRA